MKELKNFPYSQEAEIASLGAMILNHQAALTVSDLLNKGDFFDEKNALIFSAIKKLMSKNQPIEVIAIAHLLQETQQLNSVGGTAYLSHLTEHSPAPSNASYYAKIVKSKSILRGLISVCQLSIEKALEKDIDSELALDYAEKKLFDIRIGHSFEEEAEHLSAGISELYKELDRKASCKDEYVGIPSGFLDLDSMTGGFQPGRLIVIGARPAMGKSALAVSMGVNMAEKGFPVLFFSLEMPKDEIQKRILGQKTRINIAKFSQPKHINQKEWDVLAKHSSSLDSIPLYIDDTGWVTIDYLKRVSRRMIAKKKVKCIMIDHLQLIRSNKKSYSRVSELSDMTAELKILSKELQVPIILLSQLSRGVEERSDKRPQLSDLRESGSIEQDADICMFLYRDDYYNENTTSAGVTELLIRKHRSGAIGTVKLFFEKEFCRFVGIPEHQKY